MAIPKDAAVSAAKESGSLAKFLFYFGSGLLSGTYLGATVMHSAMQKNQPHLHYPNDKTTSVAQAAPVTLSTSLTPQTAHTAKPEVPLGVTPLLERPRLIPPVAKVPVPISANEKFPTPPLPPGTTNPSP